MTDDDEVVIPSFISVDQSVDQKEPGPCAFHPKGFPEWRSCLPPGHVPVSTSRRGVMAENESGVVGLLTWAFLRGDTAKKGRLPKGWVDDSQTLLSQASALALAQPPCYGVDMDAECNSKTCNPHYQRDEHRVHLVVYHFVWCPKRRKAVLTGDIAQECQTLIAQVCVEQGWTLLALAIQPDHIHLFVQVFPSTSAADVIKLVKVRTGRELRQKYAVLRKLPSLWTRSYFVSTAGRVSQETIQRYIAAQKGM